MLLYIVTEYNSKGTFLSIQKEKSCVYKVYRVIQIILYIYYSKNKKTILFQTEGKNSYNKTTLDSNKKIKKVLYKKIFLETSSI